MQNQRLGGYLLISGSVLSVIVMAFHPTGNDMAENFERLARINVLAHSAALVALPMILLGLMAVRRRLGSPDTATAALVSYGFTVVAWMFAAVASGFVQTDLFELMMETQGDQHTLYRTLSQYTHLFNQGFAKLGVVASSISIALWSAAILQSGRLSKVLAIAGMLVAISVLVAFASGHISLGVHGFGIIILTQAAWFVWLGIMTVKSPGGEQIPHG